MIEQCSILYTKNSSLDAHESANLMSDNRMAYIRNLRKLSTNELQKLTKNEIIQAIQKGDDSEILKELRDIKCLLADQKKTINEQKKTKNALENQTNVIEQKTIILINSREYDH